MPSNEHKTEKFAEFARLLLGLTPEFTLLGRQHYNIADHTAGQASSYRDACGQGLF
jgi:hypothetical protein